VVGRKVTAELVGTFVLVFFGAGSAVFAVDRIGLVGVALTFGLLLVALAYAIGPVSGAHVNPAVTLGVLLRGRITPVEAAGYWVAQFLGGIVAAAVLKALVEWGDVPDRTGTLGTNGWAPPVTAGAAFVVEVLLSALLVLVVLLVTGRATAPGFAGLAIGLTLAAIHLIGIPVSGSSVNPARSFGPALFSGSHALGQFWLYLLAPLVGAALAAAVWPLVRSDADVDPRRAESVAATEDAVAAAEAGEAQTVDPLIVDP
jgi:aquaporin Z